MDQREIGPGKCESRGPCGSIQAEEGGHQSLEFECTICYSTLLIHDKGLNY